MAGHPAVFGTSKYGKPILLHQLRQHPGTFYKFQSKKKTQDGTSYWSCMGCIKKKISFPDNKVPSVTVSKTNLLSTDPEATKNDHFCQPFTEADVEAEQLDRDARQGLRENGGNPSRAHGKALKRIVKKFAGDHLKRNAVEQSFPDYKNSASTSN